MRSKGDGQRGRGVGEIAATTRKERGIFSGGTINPGKNASADILTKSDSVNRFSISIPDYYRDFSNNLAGDYFVTYICVCIEERKKKRRKVRKKMKQLPH